MEFILSLVYIGVVIYIANQDDLRRSMGETSSPQGAALPWMLYGLVAVTVLFAVMIFYLAFSPDVTAAAMEELGRPSITIDRTAASVNLALAFVLGGLAAQAVTTDHARLWIRKVVSSAYNPASSVHTTAFVLALLVVSVVVGQYVQQGGMEGLAGSLKEENSLAPGTLLFYAFLQVVIAFLGIGLAIRRALPQSLERLGLRVPTGADIRWGIGGALAVFAVSRVIIVIWIALLSPEQFDEQTRAADQIAQMFDTLPLAFILSISAAVGEEVLFRGALQPVFGWIPTSIFFALLHNQYTLTPATIIIFIVALGFGWLRQRQSTTSAIIAHFFYNFVPLVLQLLVVP